MRKLPQLLAAPPHRHANPAPERWQSSAEGKFTMSHHRVGFKQGTTPLPRLIAHRDHRSRQGAEDDGQVMVEPVAAQPGDRKSQGDRAECAPPPSPALPAGFNPYFDLPPV